MIVKEEQMPETYTFQLRVEARRGSDVDALSDRLAELIRALPIVQADTYEARATQKKRGGVIQHQAAVRADDRMDAVRAIADVYREDGNLVDRINEARLSLITSDYGIAGFATDDFRADREFERGA